MGKTNDGNGRDASSLILPTEPIEYVLGGIRLAMNATPTLLIQGPEFESTGGWARHPQAVAVFAAAAMEIKTLREELGELRKQLGELTPVMLKKVGMPGEIGGVEGEHIEADPEEAERDYNARVRNIAAQLARMELSPNEIGALARLECTPDLNSGAVGPSLGDVRKMEAWLNVHGGVGWLGQNG